MRSPKVTRVSLAEDAKAKPGASRSGTTAAGRYDQLSTDRAPFLTRAYDSAKLTIPYLFPPAGHQGSTPLPTPYQGIGARGLNNLAAKLLLALMPPNAPFFRFIVDDMTLQKITQQDGMRAMVDKALGSVERTIETKLEVMAVRVPFFEALKQLIVSGNALCYMTPDCGMKVFRLDRYVVRRDTMGTLLEIVVREDVARDSLPEDVEDEVFGPDDDDSDEETPEGESGDDESAAGDVQLYTWVRYDCDASQWTIQQEINGQIITSSKGTYPKDKSPWLPLRWTKVDNEDYGRGYVEEYLGDLKSLEALTKAVVEGSAAAAKVLFLVNPNGTTRADHITSAPNGAVRTGNAADVTVLQMQKYADFKIAKETIDQITQRLSFAFLLNTSVQRNGERVTAEEIRFMAGELEDALGGVYSILTQEYQRPMITCLIHQMERAKELPKLPHDLITPTITTGLEALGRGQDLNRLQQFIAALQPLGPTALQYLMMGDFITRVGTSLAIDMDGLVKPEQQVQQEQQQAQQAQMMQNVAPHVVKGVSDNLKQAQANQAQQQQAPQQGPPQHG